MNVIRRDLGPATAAKLYQEYERIRGVRDGSAANSDVQSERQNVAAEMGISKKEAKQKQLSALKGAASKSTKKS